MKLNRKKIFVVLIMVALVTMYFAYPYVNEHAFYLAEKLDLIQETWNTKPLTNVSKGDKIILFYTSYHRKMPWPYIRAKENRPTDSEGKECRVSKCVLSFHRGDFARSDAVLFYGSSMPARRRLESILWKKPHEQKWVWYNGENPEKIKYSVKSINHIFDLTVTYRRDSNVYDPYAYYVLHNSPENDTAMQQVQKEILSKDRFLLWQVSNCDAALRIKIVKAISKYVHVDVFGKCQKYFNHSGNCGRWRTSCDALSRRYKFYLALENYNCKDYVTEKYWKNALERNIVPIVVAGTYNKDILIPGSYIDILDFPNAQSLVKYLLYLNSNTTAYSMYFQWKKSYKLVTTENWLCNLCEILHQNNSDKATVDLGKFWGTQNCHADDWFIENVWIKSHGIGPTTHICIPAVILFTMTSVILL